MPRHSKNNTTLPFLTYDERNKLKYGTKEERLGRHSKRDFDACYLCLQMANDPVICPKGHLSCRQCIYESLLQQKKEAKRQQEAYEHQMRELEAKDEAERQKALSEAVKQFDADQNSLVMDKNIVRKKDAKAIRDDGLSVRDASNQRLYPKTEGASTDVQPAKKETGSIKADEKSLVAFWIPGLTPAAEATKLKPGADKTSCLASDPPHSLKMKQLSSVKFTPVGKVSLAEAKYRDRNDRWMCPGCIKTLTNNNKVVVLRSCGHVFCKKCCTDLVEPARQCPSCSAVCPPNEMVDLQHEGTGYTSHGDQVVAKRYTTAFPT
eukprot:comp21646_c1_seq1/m.30422 comp21646_c1_seq1/g.30422  ORF comp21646_c1_seq1/g.30422 comp21646_c1_seq1/m.30422 type:complete len:321 (-) comp21646_c1_seq1:156-1118(-)